MFTSLSQDSSQATFCGLLQKTDRLVDPYKQTAWEIYNHWRAFVLYPKTAFFSAYFGQEVRILSCALAIKDLSSFQKAFETETVKESDLQDAPYLKAQAEVKVLFEDAEWLQVKIQRQLKTYLLCQKQTLLEVHSLILASGQTLNFRGFFLQVKN